MKNFFVYVLDTVLPPHQDVVAVREIFKPLTIHPRELLINNLPITTLFSYQDTSVGACIRAAKYHHHQKATSLLGNALKTYLANHLSDSVIIPIPLSATRLRQRGHNQVVSILKAADIPYRDGVLTRVERNSQTSFTREERLRNVTGAMSIAPSTVPCIEGKNVLVIDDVVTTGATLAEAGRAIAIARPASVKYLALAH